MKTWYPILAALVIFAAGILTGGVVMKLTTPEKESVRRNFPQDFGLNQRMEHLNWMAKQLNLAEQQRQQIEGIYRESHERMKVLWQDVNPKAQGEMRKTRERVREILTEEQRVKLDELNKQRSRRKPDDPASRDNSKREHRRPSDFRSFGGWSNNPAQRPVTNTP